MPLTGATPRTRDIHNVKVKVNGVYILHGSVKAVGSISSTLSTQMVVRQGLHSLIGILCLSLAV